MRGNVYLHNNFYDEHNNLILSDDYRNGYKQGLDSEFSYMTNAAISNYIYEYVDLLREKYTVSDINLMTYNDVMHILTAINPYGVTFDDDNYLLSGDDDSIFEWEEGTYDEDSLHGYSYWFTSMLNYIPEQYKWLYDSTYWLATSWIWNSSSPDTDPLGNEGFYYGLNYQFFINTQGNLCSIDGHCGQITIPAGIRPVITMAADQFSLNETFDINGTVRWIDNNNASNIRPLKSTIHLFRNGVEIASTEVTKGEEDDLWHFTFANLRKYDDEGNEYVYSLSQNDIPQYSSNINDFNIINRYGPDNPNTIDHIAIYGIIGSITLMATVTGFTIKRSRR